MICEIQIRTKLQDAWGDVTHEFHYKAKNSGVDNKVYEKNISEIASRLADEDQLLINLRNAYQSLADEKSKNKTREGFHED
jgi:putative GTP pyrophosphokinase